MKKFIALAALVLMSMVTTTVYAQESNAQRRADRKAQRDALCIINSKAEHSSEL